MRVIAEFRKEGAARYISHLDLMRVMQRAMRRAGMPVAYSVGFNPHAQMSFATAVPVGCSSECEIMDVQMERDIETEAFCREMNLALPDGIHIDRALSAEAEAPAPMAAGRAARYSIRVPGELRVAALEFMESKERFAMKTGKKGARQVDIRPMVYELSAVEENGETMLCCTLRHDGALAIKPSLLMESLGAPDAQAHRTALLIGREGKWDSLYSLYERGNA